MQRSAASCILYCILASFITGWWLLAFKPQITDRSLSAVYAQDLSLTTSQLLEELSPLQRDALHQALSGDFSLIIKLIDHWDKDAQALVNRGCENIQRLSSEQYLQAHILGHFLQEKNPDDLRTLNCKINLEFIRDDCGRFLKIEDRFSRFLPQTYVAASFLLAIAHPHEIIGLPRGMRHLPSLYSHDRLAAIPENIDRTHSEKLFLADPHLAFVAPYSHPPALEALRSQKIKLYTISTIDNIDQIQASLLKVGHASNHIIEAQLLAIFIEASLIAIDNRLSLLNETASLSNASMKMLYLYYHEHFMMPTSKCLTGQLMARALSHCPRVDCRIPESQQDWRIPFEQERIIQADPDCLLISTPFDRNGHCLQTHNLPSEGISKGPSNPSIIFIDETVQESPTQYIVLAYYDIYQAFERFLSLQNAG